MLDGSVFTKCFNGHPRDDRRENRVLLQRPQPLDFIRQRAQHRFHVLRLDPCQRSGFGFRGLGLEISPPSPTRSPSRARIALTFNHDPLSSFFSLFTVFPTPLSLPSFLFSLNDPLPASFAPARYLPRITMSASFTSEYSVSARLTLHSGKEVSELQHALATSRTPAQMIPKALAMPV